MNRIDRLFALVLLLQVKRQVTAREIAEQFHITERTVYRDMKALAEMGVPIASQAHDQRSFRLNRILSWALAGETFTPRTIIPAHVEPIEVCVRFAAHGLPQVRERPHYALVRDLFANEG